MVICETLPLCPDTELDAETSATVTEPVEVGPFTEGVVFVKVLNVEGEAAANVDIGLSHAGYEDWGEHWVTRKRMQGLEEERLHEVKISNFGNWLRLRPSLDARGPDSRVVLAAWFAGKG